MAAQTSSIYRPLSYPSQSKLRLLNVSCHQENLLTITVGLLFSCRKTSLLIQAAVQKKWGPMPKLTTGPALLLIQIRGPHQIFCCPRANQSLPSLTRADVLVKSRSTICPASLTIPGQWAELSDRFDITTNHFSRPLFSSWCQMGLRHAGQN